MSTQPPAPAPDGGKLAGWLGAVKGLTISNALVIIMLVIVAIPAYLVYRALNDTALLDRLLADYKEESSQQTSCTLRSAHERGAANMWAISTGFAYQGSDKWMVSVAIDHAPNADQMESYCATLLLIVDFMHDPDARSPPAPGTNKPLIWQYGGSQSQQH